jgi:hypothetical protein
MIPEKGKRYLITYHFDNHYTDIGTYTGETWREKDGLEYKFKVNGGTLLATDEDIIKCIDNPNDGSTLDNFLLLEKLKAWENCADNLIAYAHGFVNSLSIRGIGYKEHDGYIKQAEDAIEEYNRLKK